MARLANEKFKDTEKHHEKVFPLTSRAKFVRASNTEKAPKNKTNHTKKPSGKPDNDDLKIKTRVSCLFCLQLKSPVISQSSNGWF